MIKHLQVETTNICNAECQFCPHDKFEKFGYMEESLYRKIIDDASQYNLISFAPMLTGEPFCDPDIMSRIAYARDKMPDTLIRIYTNGSMMTARQIEILAGMKGIEINISLNGHDASRRLEMMGLGDWGEVVEKIRLIEKLGIRFAVSTVWHPIYSIEEINKFLKLPKAMLIRFQSFGGQVYKFRRLNPTSCSRVTEMMTVLYTGQVNLCCFDPFGEVNFGDLNRQTIEEVWNGELHQEYLEKHRTMAGQTLNICSRCTEGS